MITSLLLTLSMLGQYGHIKPFWTVPPEVKDMAFNQIQIDWVYQQRKNAVYKWESVLSQEDADLLDALDAEKFSIRRFARRHLKKMGFDAVTACSWGMNSKSAELREVCSNHLFSLYRCTYCNGTGMIERQNGQSFRYNVFCQGCTQNSSCQYGGNFYCYEKYDPEKPNTLEYRDLFAPTVPREKDEDVD